MFTMHTTGRFRLLPVTALLVVAAAAACDDPLALSPATFTNAVDTVRLYALRGTDLVRPSGYDLPSNATVRTDQAAFDFAFDLDGRGTALIYPAGALGLTKEPGIVKMTAPFDSVISAPSSGYVDSVAVSIPPGTVFVARSRIFSLGCSFAGSLPRYGKFHVLSVDSVARSLTMEALVNQNCGYRDLRPGLPTA